MGPPSCQFIQEYGKRCNNCLSLPCCHFCNFTLMKGHSSYQLDIVVYHIPHDLVSACYPPVLPVSLITLYRDAFPCSCQIFVILPCCYFYHTVFLESSGCFLHYCKGRRNTLIKDLLELVINMFFNLVNLVIYLFFQINIRFSFSLLLQ